ncbi:MAG: TonB-dependent receptor plug domain-containing protein [Woeseiaceae bacterium]|nr:TonB-dependent receptor plug domain-containing protein [Woeseiaceae bacterium]
MQKKFASSIVAAAVAAALFAPASAIAQDEETSLFDEIQVTAQRRVQSIYEVPVALSAFDGDKLAQQGIVNIQDVGKFVPNLNITEFSAGHTSSSNPFIRGIGLQDHLITTDPGVSVYVDGVYLGRQVGQNWNLTNIERIEVLRGPQGTLYGRNSIGGAINIITKTPGADPGASVSVEFGSRERLNGSFYGDASLGDWGAVSITGGFKNRDGLGDFLNLPNAGVRVGEQQEVYARLAFLLNLSDSATLTIAGDMNEGEGGLRPYTTLIDELPNGAVFGAGYRNSDVSRDPYDNNTGQASQALVTNNAEGISLTLDWEMDDENSLRVIASQRQSEYKAGLDDDSFVDDFLSFPETGFADQTSIEIQWSGDYGNWDFVSGLYYFEEDGGNNQDPTVFLTFPGTFFLQQDVTSQALFANFGFDVSDALRVSAGLRYTEDEKQAFTNVGNGLYDDNVDFDEISWDLSANLTLDNGMNIYGSIQSGYQSGQYPARPFCLFGDADGPGNDNDCFKASENITAINYEAGIKGELFENVQIAATAFFTQYSDLPYQVSTTSGGGFNTVNLIVDQDSLGLELESTVFFTENLSLQASLGYIDVDVDEEGGVKPVAPLTPDLTASLSPQIVFPISGGGEWAIRADWSYRDEMYGEPSSDPGRQTLIDSRDILNADISYTSADGSWTAGLYGRNVTDERYDNARLNTGDYLLVILSNDASEFGLRFTKDFD